MSRITFFCTTMRRFFHRKTSQTRPGTATSPQQLGHRPRSSSSSSSTNSPVHGPPTATGRVRAPNLRSRSMSVLNGPAIPAAGTSNARRFTRSLSFCAENQIGNSSFTRQLTTSEEDEVFRTYTRRVYGVFGALCAIIVGIAVYAYMYNYGNR